VSPRMDEPKRYFTLEQANAAVAAIRPILREMLEIRQRIIDLQPEVWPVIEKAVGNGGSLAASQATREFERINSLAHEIQAIGGVIKDLNSGLVDFPAMREGREVYLCWKYGEQQIEYWHEVDLGFSSRQPWS
jgi:hypothetical protein